MTNNSQISTPDVSLRKSLWSRILSRIRSWKDDIDKALEIKGGVDSVAFSISFIALSAKLAKADGQVTRDEVTMFRRIFTIPPSEEARAAQVYDLCRQNVTGFESYARRMNKALGGGEAADAIRIDVLDGLFHIAMADGEFHPQEEVFLEAISQIFNIETSEYLAMISRHVPERTDPFAVLGLDRNASIKDITQARRRLAKQNHPDILMSRGLPEEMMKLASDRLKSINEAFDAAKNIIDARPEIDGLGI